MRIPVFLLLLLVGARPIVAQNAKLDSLSRLLRKATTDTARVNLNAGKIAELSRVNLDSALALGERTLALARKIGYRRGEANVRLQLVTTQCFKGDFAAAGQHLRRAEALFSSLNDSTAFARLYSSFGMFHGMQSRYDSAAIFYEKVIRLAQRLNNDDLLGTAYQNLAISYQMQSNYQQALAYYQKALDLAAGKDLSTQAFALINMGITFKTIGDTARAERALLDGIRFAKQAGIRNVELYAYSNLASLYDFQRKYPKSYQYAMQAAVLAEQTGDVGIQSSSLSKAAWALAAQKQFYRAEAMNRQAIELAEASRQPLNIFQVYATMGSIFKAQEKYAAALPHLERAFRALTGADIYDEQIGSAYADLAFCYEKTGNYQRALSAFKTASEITDSVRSKESIRKSTELSLNYEFDKKQELAQAEQEVARAESRTRQQALGIGLLITVVLMGLAFLGYRTKQRDNALLEAQTAQIQRNLTELRATQAQLIQSEKMASLGELTAGIAHEIQNPLNFVNNFSEVSAELVGELAEERKKGDERDEGFIDDLLQDLEQNLQKITHHGKRADLIVKGMLQHSRTSTGRKEPTDLNLLAEEYLRIAYTGLRAKDRDFAAHLETDLDETLGPVAAVPQDLGRVLLNLFNNAFYAVAERKKTAPEGYQPTVRVSTKRAAEGVAIRVTDNGVGIPDAVKAKIFQPFFTTKPTGEGTGLGLSLSYDIVTKGHGGTLIVESTEGEGTAFVVRLPTTA